MWTMGTLQPLKVSPPRLLPMRLSRDLNWRDISYCYHLLFIENNRLQDELPNEAVLTQ